MAFTDLLELIKLNQLTAQQRRQLAETLRDRQKELKAAMKAVEDGLKVLRGLRGIKKKRKRKIRRRKRKVRR